MATIATQQLGRKRQIDPVNKILIINREITTGRINVVFDNEVLGF